MYSLIFVDDEDSTINGIVSGIDWKDLNFELVATFTQVQDALSFMSENSVDCIISDIKMPGTDGLEFAKTVQIKFPETIFIILSAYSNFDYAQKAISYGVSNYIVKPVTYAKISDALHSAAEILERKKLFLPKKYTSVHKLISDLLTSTLADIDYIVQAFKDEHISIDPATTRFAVVDVSVVDFSNYIESSWPYDISQFQNAFSFIVESDSPYVFEIKAGYGRIELFIIASGVNSDNFSDLIEKTFRTIQNNCFEFLNCQVEFDVRRVYTNLYDIIQKSTSKEVVNMHLQPLLGKISDGNIYKSSEFLKTFLNLYKNNIEYLQDFASCLVVEINSLIPVSTTWSKYSVDKINLCTLDELRQLIYSLTDKATEYFAIKSNHSDTFIQSAKNYIDEHYNEDILLSDIANSIHISASHLSRSFKAKTGESIISYITNVRLLHARDLLLTTSLSVDEICYNVGYKSRNLFFKNFKAAYGITPKKYRTETGNEK